MPNLGQLRETKRVPALFKREKLLSFYGLLYQMLEMTPDHQQPYAPENKDASDSDEFHQSD